MIDNDIKLKLLLEYQAGGISENDIKHIISQQRKIKSEELNYNTTSLQPVAIIGISAKFPGANDLDEFWNILETSRCTITDIPKSRWDLNNTQLKNNDILEASFCTKGGFISDVSCFDAAFFNISPQEAELIDPQHRLILETSWKALEDAGYNPLNLSGSKTGVYIGVMEDDYLDIIDKIKQSKFLPQVITGNSNSILSGRISYFLNLKGPALTISTACSSSLVALHLACQSLRYKENTMALVGGVSLYLTEKPYILMNRAGMLSKTNLCKPFSEGADGFVPSEGVAVIVIKLLQDAIRDKDNIYGTILASGINQDGFTNGITSPNVASQAELISNLYSTHAIDPESISYIEAHGTGTSLGDPVEFQALTKAFKNFTNKKSYCALGSVKSNIGHTSAVAGLAGLIKVLLAMKYKKIPATLHCDKINHLIDVDQSPFVINNAIIAWTASVSLRRAGVSSFGFSGTNAHCIVEEFVDLEQIGIFDSDAKLYFFPFSAATAHSLKNILQQVLVWLKKSETFRIDYINYTLVYGRAHLRYRVLFAAKNINNLYSEIEKYLVGNGSQTFLSNHNDEFLKDPFEINADILFSKNAIIEKSELHQCLYNYLIGNEVNWENICKKNSNSKKISMPTYRFEKTHYWPDGALQFERSMRENIDENIFFYTSIWKENHLEADDQKKLNGKLILFDDKKGWREIKEKYPRLDIVLVEMGKKYEEISSKHYQVRIDVEEDYNQLVAKISQSNKPIVGVIYAWSCGLKAEKESLQVEVESFYHLIRALCKNERKSNIGLIYLYHQKGLTGVYAQATSGIIKTLNQENMRLNGRVVQTSSYERRLAEGMYELVDLISKGRRVWEIEYVDRIRKEKIYKRVKLGRSSKSLLKEGGVYWITGGLGGLGKILSSYLVERYHAKVILSGRSPYGGNERSRRGGIKYYPVDVADKEQVAALRTKIMKKYKKLDGIFHVAGIINDSFILKKNWQGFKEVINPKVTGIRNIDEVLQGDQIDFQVYYSSVASILGNIGQSDYSYGNSFMDAYVQYREEQRKVGKRMGKTISINWPLWESGGMDIKSDEKELLLKEVGMKPLPSELGLRVLETCLEAVEKFRHIMPFYGDVKKWEKRMQERGCYYSELVDQPSNDIFAIDSSLFLDDIKEKTLRYLRGIIAAIAKIPYEKIDAGIDFDNYGINSIMIYSFNAKAEKYFGKLPTTLFFEYKNLEKLTDYFVEKHLPVLRELFAYDALAKSEYQDIKKTHNNFEPIAIIGIAGYYPKSENIEQFWKHLQHGDDCIIEIPKSRWDCAPYIVEAKTNGFQYCLWGAFLENFNHFNPLFFNMSPLDAEFIDPQERLLLQIIWHTLEDAGYTTDSLHEKFTQNGVCKVGVYIGVTSNTYQFCGAEAWLHGKRNIPVTNFWSIPNRISYFFDLHGPSMPIDTACSSSLVAVHLACEALQQGNCNAAIVGGVNLYLHPYRHYLLSRDGFTSSDGKCRSYGEGGNGFVPGEGIGAMLLRPLKDAEKDGDRIYGVIIGSAINHSGKTKGFTIPSPNFQADVINRAIKIANIDPKTITYIEGHGTATALGDPIEVRGLEKVFGESQNSSNKCALGSVKSNIGHLEAAAGIAGLTKVILQLQYKKIIPSLHSEILNQKIPFTTSCFYIPQVLHEWSSQKFPRRAGVSSFGAGGVNAHLIVEEYKERSEPVREINFQKHLFIFSAKNREELQFLLKNIREFLKQAHNDINILNLAYTLQIGRTAMPVRLAIISSSILDLITRLEQYLEDKYYINDQLCFTSPSQVDSEAMTTDYDVNKLLEERQLITLAKLWASGVNINWRILYDKHRGKIISLPKYPFGDKAFFYQYFLPKDEQNIDKMISRNIENINHHSLIELLQTYLLKRLSFALKVEPNQLDINNPLEEYGIDSINIKSINAILEEDFGQLPRTLLLECENIKMLADYLLQHCSKQIYGLFVQNPNMQNNATSQKKSSDIAIIGLGGYFPEAKDIRSFWNNLLNKKASFSEIPTERWDFMKYYSSEKGVFGKIYCKYGAFIQNANKFDYSFFNFTPREASEISPLERILLEVTWKTIEDAGYTRENLLSKKERHKAGVFVGISANEYGLLYANEDFINENILPNNSFASIANRISYFFDLRGPSIAIDTMCASSSTAFHYACEAIKKAEINIALVGGVHLLLHPFQYIKLSRMSMLTGDSHVDVFNDDSDGFIPGEAVTAVLLKPLADAVKDKDNIYAVVKATGINHTGKSNSYTMPSLRSQINLYENVYTSHDIDPMSISYVECQAMGLSLADGIELKGINEFFVSRGTRGSTKKITIGSVKPNIGHSEAASGLSQLIKVILQLKNKTFLPTIISENNFNVFHNRYPSLSIPQYPTPWEISALNKDHYYTRRRAGINSFGTSGVEVHIVLEEYSVCATASSEDYECAIIFTGRTPTMLKNNIEVMANYLEQNIGDLNIVDIAYTLHFRKEKFVYSLIFIAKNIKSLLAQLKNYLSQSTQSQLGIVYYDEENEGSLLFNQLQSGENIDWDKWYRNKQCKRISLPTTNFENKNCLPAKSLIISADKERDDILNIVEATLRKTTGIHNLVIDLNKSLLDYGLTSIGIIDFKYILSRDFKIEVSSHDIIKTKNISELLTFLENKRENSTDRKITNIADLIGSLSSDELIKLKQHLSRKH